MEEDALYGLPLERFVPERDALAKRLRAAGDREGSARVKALRKPTVAAWAVNQVARTQRAALRELDESGKALRDVHAALLRGEARGKELRAAGERERDAVEALVTAARGLLSSAGRDLSETVLQDVRDSLHAIASDDEAREAVLAARLERERRAAGLGGELGFVRAPSRPAKRGGGKGEARAAKRGGGKGEARAATPKRPKAAETKGRSGGAKRAQAAAEEAAAQAAADAAAAQDAAQRAGREHDEALRRLEAAEAALEAAKRARDAARDEERAARRARDKAAKKAGSAMAGDRPRPGRGPRR